MTVFFFFVDFILLIVYFNLNSRLAPTRVCWGGLPSAISACPRCHSRTTNPPAMAARAGKGRAAMDRLRSRRWHTRCVGSDDRYNNDRVLLPFPLNSKVGGRACAGKKYNANNRQPRIYGWRLIKPVRPACCELWSRLQKAKPPASSLARCRIGRSRWRPRR